MTMARQEKKIINRTWAPVSHRVAGGEVTAFYVNLQHATGLAVTRIRGDYTLGAVFNFRRDINGELTVIPLDIPTGGSGRSDAERALEELVIEISTPAEVEPA